MPDQKAVTLKVSKPERQHALRDPSIQSFIEAAAMSIGEFQMRHHQDRPFGAQRGEHAVGAQDLKYGLLFHASYQTGVTVFFKRYHQCAWRS